MKTKSLVLTMAGCALLAVAFIGCATKGPSPQELVMQQSQGLANDILAGKADNILSYVSDSFTNEHVASKADIADHIKKAKDSGKLEKYVGQIKEHEAKIDFNLAKVAVNAKDNTATVYPITASADVGEVTVRLNFKLDPDKVWRVAGIDIEGI